MGKKYPSKDELLESVVYDETSGSIRWRHTTAQKRAGDIAGYLNETGYIYIRFRSYGFLRAHRIAWIMVHGCIPDGMQIDHIDGNHANNALSNLRLATYSQNGANRNANRAKETGVKGVYKDQQTIRAMQGVKSANDLAAEYSVSRNVIYHIWTRSSWAHVPELPIG